MTRLRIACYYPWLYLRSGVERTILQTVRRSRHDWTLYTNHYDRDGTYPEFKALNVIELPRVSVDRSFGHVATAAIRIYAQKLPMDRHDLLFVHSEGLGDLIVFRNHSKPIICYCHQPLLVANEGGVRNRYLYRNPRKAALLNISASIFKMLDRSAWRYYSYLFVTSRTVQQLAASGGLPMTQQVVCLPPGVDCNAMRPSGKTEPFFLAFSRLKWWKNVELSIKAFRIALQSNWVTEFRLVVAGQVDAGSETYLRELHALAKDCPRITIVKNPNAAQVHELYKNCYAVLNCTLCEAWGMVPLEANAYGKAVIAVNRGGTAESQVHGVTGLLADPTPLEFARAMRTLAADPELAASMGRAARANAQQYDWSLYVRTLDEELDRIGENVVNTGQDDSDRDAVLAA